MRFPGAVFSGSTWANPLLQPQWVVGLKHRFLGPTPAVPLKLPPTDQHMMLYLVRFENFSR